MSTSPAKHTIKGLDGLRALAVLLVLAFHLFPQTVGAGFIGVDIFFVISGFIITYLLLQERAKTGHILFGQFWMKRIRRLVPALVIVVAISLAIGLFIGGDSMVGVGKQAAGALTFSYNWVQISLGTNYFDALHPQLFTHFWSLAVEEQFYVVWPLIISVVLLVPISKRYKLGFAVCVAIAGISALLMTLLYAPGNPTRVYYGTDTHIFGLMLGAAVAFWGYLPRKKAIGATGKRWLAASGGFALLGLCIIAGTMSFSYDSLYWGGLFGVSLLTVVLLVAVTLTRGMLHRFFALKPLRWVGERSYGIYLWHWPLIVLFGAVLTPYLTPWLFAVAIVVASFALAHASYTYIEMPIRQAGFKQIWHRWIVAPIRSRHKSVNACFATGAVASCAVITLSLLALAMAPSQTQLQTQLEANAQFVAKQNAHTTQPVASSDVPPVVHASTQPTSVAPPHTHTPTGNDISFIGDSVTLASAPQVEATFPGIAIDAQVSRAFRTGGMSDIESQANAGSLRTVVVIELGTNGYYGAGNLNKILQLLHGHRVIVITSHCPEEWCEGNNQELQRVVPLYPYVSIADWDRAITGHDDDLSSDGVHPINAAGKQVFAHTLKTAVDALSIP